MQVVIIGQETLPGKILKTEQPVVEWPTLFVMIATYLTLGLATTWLSEFSLPLAIFVTGIAIAQFSSLQHEVLHGHPFRNRWLSEATVFPGVTAFIPYIRFKDLHLAHHHDPILTDPYDDPESNFLDPKVWAGMPNFAKVLYKANNTLFGRILFGPAVSICCFVKGDVAVMVDGNRHVMKAWVLHGVGVLILVGWLLVTEGMPIWAYLIAAYFGFGLLKIRTFLEHRAHDLARARSVVIEDRGFFALLFLNNNFHSVHHSQPGLAWYQLPRLFAENREHYLTRNEGYFFTSYWQIFRQYFFHAKDPVAHPLWTDANKR
jgi:fatty acid desaturase